MLNFNEIVISNGIEDELYISSEVSTPYSTTIPTIWDSNTIFDAKFNDNLNAGNVDFVLSQVDTILIKRRLVGTTDWITIFRIPVSNSIDLNFTKIDRWCGYGDYQYAVVPSLNGTEGQYATIDVQSRFNGFFLCNKDNTFKFLAEASYGGMEQRTNVGIFEPFGKEYPTVVQNAKTNYKKFTFSAKLLSSSFYTTRQISPTEDRLLRESLLQVLATRKPMILKDYLGNSFMVTIADSKMVNFLAYSGNSQMDISLPFVEIGNVNNQSHLDKNGFV